MDAGIIAVGQADEEVVSVELVVEFIIIEVEDNILELVVGAEVAVWTLVGQVKLFGPTVWVKYTVGGMFVPLLGVMVPLVKPSGCVTKTVTVVVMLLIDWLNE